MRNFLVIISFLTTVSFSFQEPSEEQNQPGYIGESKYYTFYSHYWFNMHHLFQQEALTLEVAGKSTILKDLWEQLEDADKEKLNEVIEYYRKNMVEKDLRTSYYMSDFRKWIIQQNQSGFDSVPDKFKEHILQLLTIDKIYREYFWPIHEESNKQVLESNWDLLTNTEDTVVSRLMDLTREYWQKEKIRVDICYFAKSTKRNMRNRPYTPLNPTHVVMNSSNNSAPAGDWIELLYHESSHHLIGSVSGFVGGTIMDVVEKLGGRAPRQLWHAYLFYFSGKVSQEVFSEQGIKDYKLYMYRNKVFTWYSPHLEKYLDAYMNNKVTLKDATEKMILDIRKSN